MYILLYILPKNKKIAVVLMLRSLVVAAALPAMAQAQTQGQAAVAGMVDNIVGGLAVFLVPLAILIITGAAFFFIISRGNPIAIKAIAAVLVGLFIFMLAKIVPAAVVGIFM